MNFYIKPVAGFLLICTMAACSEPAKKTISAKEKFDAIEKVVGTNNWELTMLYQGFTDTSYVYFSRTGDTHFNIYSYHIKNGDSTRSFLVSMINRNDSVVAVGENFNYYAAVTDITDTSFVLHNAEPYGNSSYTRQDSLHIVLKDSTRSGAILRKTLPLAVFLVRKRYDYLHGTSYADSAEVAPRGMNK